MVFRNSTLCLLAHMFFLSSVRASAQYICCSELPMWCRKTLPYPGGGLLDQWIDRLASNQKVVRSIRTQVGIFWALDSRNMILTFAGLTADYCLKPATIHRHLQHLVHVFARGTVLA